MDHAKLNRILDKMRDKGLPQMIISDPTAIFYLTGKWILPGERMHALYINTEGKHMFVMNNFSKDEIIVVK